MSTPAKTTSAAAAAATSRVVPQGGILEGGNPSQYDPKNPIVLFIIQAGIIIIFCRLLHYPLSRLRQPRVIAEVIGGILLGPSVMGRIPGFTAAIFPAASMPSLNLVANLGLVLFLFLVGLEADLRLLLSNWRVALGVGAAGMIIPFGLGCAIAYGLYHEFAGEPGTVHVGFGVFMLFIGVAMAITAFPVLCRILTELKLLGTPVGVIVLSAGVGNDVTGWILLALCVALVNAGSGITALYVFLTCLGWVLFLALIVRPLFLKLLHRTGSIQNGPSESIIALTLLMVLTSAWFTGVIGVHPIFGGFLVGLICPHEAGFAIKITEKIEDLVTVLFLPLYFALSGLSTNLGLLDSGITWAYVIGVLAIAFFGKVVGGALAARAAKLVWRESFTIGVLMSCKGLVELIVLNIGLQAKILSTRTFTIFVVMALITTFATTPLTSALYPPWYQKKLDAWKRGEIDWDGQKLSEDDSTSGSPATIRAEKHGAAPIRRLLVHLRLDSLSSLFTFINLLGGHDGGSTVQPKVHPRKAMDQRRLDDDGATATVAAALQPPPAPPLEVHGVRMIELTDRASSVMRVSAMDADGDGRDPLVDVLHTFGRLNQVAVSGGVAVVPEDSYAETLAGKASDMSSDLLLVPWCEAGTITEVGSDALAMPAPDLHGLATQHGPYLHFINDILARARCSTAILINRGFGGRMVADDQRALGRTVSRFSLRSNGVVPAAPIADRSHHVFMPFVGGVDDRAALRFVWQLAQNTNVTATVTLVEAGPTPMPSSTPTPNATSGTASANESATAMTLSPEPVPAWDPLGERAFFNALRDSLPAAMESRVVFDTLVVPPPASDFLVADHHRFHAHETRLRAVLDRAVAEVRQSPRNAGNLIVVGRRSGLAPGAGAGSSSKHSETATRQALGELGDLLVSAGLGGASGTGVGAGYGGSHGHAHGSIYGGGGDDGSGPLLRASIIVIQAGKRERGHAE
ncbi:MAG: K(+)/H(+) antiporter [Phylliscum demangeonii]|nr:MAG: K(+)/H(+) antiporter [Phylliscum demangeonii]